MTELEFYRSYFRYDESTGKLYWKKKPSGIVNVGDEAGGLFGGKGKEYLRTAFKGKRLLVHRVIWFIQKGYWPDVVDHINGNGLDNRLSNLRDTDNQGNCRNRSMRSDNKTGHKGVSWCKNRKSWRVRIHHRGKELIVGYFDCLELAGLVATEARELLGYHENHGRVRGACAI